MPRTSDVNSLSEPRASGSKSRFTPSAPRSRSAAAIWRARFARADAEPRRLFWRFRPDVFQPKLWIVRTTRVWLRWAAEMMLVSRELVQPLQPTVVEPLEFRFWRLPDPSAPIPK